MLNCLSFFIFPPFSLKWVWASARFEAFGREPVDRRLAKCDAGSSRTEDFPRRSGGFSALGCRIALCIFHVARTLAQRWLFPSRRARTAVGAESRTAATRAHGGERCPLRKGCKPFKALPPYPLAPASARAIGRRGALKECRDFVLRFSASALKCRAALQAQGLPRLVLAASETCAARLPSAWSLSAPALCRSGCCQQSHRRSPSTESHAPDEVQMQWLRPPVQGCSCPARQCGAYRRFSAARRSKRFWLKRGSR